MPVMSYLAYPADNEYEGLVAALDQIDGCDVIESEGREVLVVVTDTASKAEERTLRDELEAIPQLACLAMVFGHDDPAPDADERSPA